MAGILSQVNSPSFHVVQKSLVSSRPRRRETSGERGRVAAHRLCIINRREEESAVVRRGRRVNLFCSTATLGCPRSISAQRKRTAKSGCPTPTLLKTKCGLNCVYFVRGERSSAGRASVCGIRVVLQSTDSPPLAFSLSRIYHGFITRE